MKVEWRKFGSYYYQRGQVVGGVNEKLAISFMSHRKALLVEFDWPFPKHSFTPIQDRPDLTICEYLRNVYQLLSSLPLSLSLSFFRLRQIPSCPMVSIVGTK